MANFRYVANFRFLTLPVVPSCVAVEVEETSACLMAVSLVMVLDFGKTFHKT